jgi:hypothetical protein
LEEAIDLSRDRQILDLRILGPTQPPVQWVPGALSPGVKRPVRKTDHSPLSSNAIPVKGREGPYGCETSTLPQFLDNRLTDASEVVPRLIMVELYLHSPRHNGILFASYTMGTGSSFPGGKTAGA